MALGEDTFEGLERASKTFRDHPKETFSSEPTGYPTPYGPGGESNLPISARAYGIYAGILSLKRYIRVLVALNVTLLHVREGSISCAHAPWQPVQTLLSSHVPKRSNVNPTARTTRASPFLSSALPLR